MRRLLLALAFVAFAIPAHAANCFWVGGTGSLTPSNTASWSSSSGGTAGTCAGAGGVPGSGDVATFDGSSGGGTVTLNFGGTWTIASLVCGAFTGTIDNSVNNNNVTFNGTASTPFNCSGSAARTLKLGSATYTINSPAGGSIWNVSNGANLTLQAGTSTITWAGSVGNRSFFGGGKTYNTITVPSISGSPSSAFYTFSDGFTVGTLNIAAPNYVQFNSSSIVTVTNAFTWTGTSSNPIGLDSSSSGGAASIVASGGGTIQYASVRDMQFSGGGVTATNSLDLGSNSGVTITGPGAGGGGGCIISGWLLWRDMPGHINDNFPAWVEKAG